VDYQNIDIDIEASTGGDLDADCLREVVVRAFEEMGQPPEVGVTLLVTTDERIRELNRTHRQVDAPTDVLSFSATGDIEFVTPVGLPPYLGDIVISLPTARRQAAECQHALRDEMALLIVHGILHVLGYDHESPPERAVMWARQAEVLSALGVEMPRDL